MADSLLLDGTDDLISFGNGGLGVYGPGTLAVILKLTRLVPGGESHHYMYNGSWGMFLSDAETPSLQTNAGSSFYTGNPLSVNNWEFTAVTKATGTALPKFHQYDGTTWTHNDGDTSLANSSDPSSVQFGGTGFSGEWFQGNLLVAGYWSSVLSDGALEALTSMSAWQSAAPVEAWRFDTMSAIQSFGTTGGSNETSRVGTTLDTGDAPSWWSEDGGPITGQQFSWHFG